MVYKYDEGYRLKIAHFNFTTLRIKFSNLRFERLLPVGPYTMQNQYCINFLKRGNYSKNDENVLCLKLRCASEHK